MLDYHFYRNCTIRNCTIIYGGAPCQLEDNTIMDNTMEYRGAAGWTLALQPALGPVILAAPHGDHDLRENERGGPVSEPRLRTHEGEVK